MKAISRELGKIAAALSFLSILPVPGKKVLEGSSAYYPLAGWLMGGALYLVWTATRGLPNLAQAFIVLAVWELLPRGLHIDALADTADAFVAGGSRERMLGIMSDTSIGAFGVAAIVLVLVGKFALLASLGFADGRGALVCAAVMGRYSLSLLCCLFRPAKDQGLGSLIIANSGARELAIATLLALVPLGILFTWHALYAASGLAAALLLALYARWKVGGLTGDVVGAGLELAELASLFSFM